MPFPLLCLPYLALVEILKSMKAIDLINLVADKKSLQRLIQTVGVKSGGYDVSIADSGFMFNMKNRMEKLKGAGKLFNEARRVFPGEIDSLEVCMRRTGIDLSRIPMDCSVLTIGSYQEQSHDLNDVINRINVKNGLQLYGNTALFEKNSKIYKVDYLKIDNADWITSSILQRLQNRILDLEEVTLGEADINAFLKSFSRLESAEFLKCRPWNMTQVLDGMKATPIKKPRFPKTLDPNDPIKKYFTSWYEMEDEDDGSNFDEEWECYDVTRQDGVRMIVGRFTGVYVSVYVLEKVEESRKRRRRSDEDGNGKRRRL